MNKIISFMGPKFHKFGTLAARFIIGGVLVYAGFSKATNPIAEFAAAIDVYQILPSSWVMGVAIVLPWLEFYTGIFLLFGFFGRSAATFATLFFAVFLTVFWISILRGIHLDSCGCFGSGLSLSLPQAFAFDLFLFALSSYLLVKPSQFISVDDWVSKG